jgi:type II secretory pathway component PulF
MMNQADPGSTDYLDTISVALEKSGELQKFIEAAIEDDATTAERSRLRRFLKALQEEKSATVWTHNPELAALLPVVLVFSQERGEVDGQKWKVLQHYLLSNKLTWIEFLKARAYPVVLTIFVIAIIAFIAFNTLPIFEKLFDEFGLSLPIASQAVFQVGRTIRTSPFGILSFLAVLGVLWFGALEVAKYILQFLHQSSLFGYWFVGNRRHLEAMGRWTATLAELLDIGTPLPKAVAIAGVATQHYFYHTQAAEMSQVIGDTNQSLVGHRVARGFSPTAIAALYASDGRPSISVLRQLADVYWGRSDYRKDNSWSWFNVLALFLIGGAVAFVVIAIFLPLMQMITSLS